MAEADESDASFLLLHPLLAVLTVLVLFRMTGRGWPEGTGPLAALLLVVSGFFVFSAGSLRSHTLTGFLLVAVASALARQAVSGTRLAAVVAGAAFGFAFVTRPYTAVVAALPFVVWFVCCRRDVRATLRATGYAALGAAPFAAALFAYNAATTGSRANCSGLARTPLRRGPRASRAGTSE